VHGNAFEWVHDWEGGFGRPSATDPLGAEGGSNRVLRGGCWFFDAAYCRSAIRFRDDPPYRRRSSGFRLALSFVGVPAESGQDKNK
jgi:formylglycine-generating enzyme required for sulfatase activity